MSNHLTSLAYKASVGSLLRKSVLVLLADKASDDGSGIWASKQTMADELCCSKQAIINTLHDFVSEGILVETGKRKNQNGYTITYSLNVDILQALPKVKRWADDQSTPLTGQPDGPVNPVEGTSQPGLPKPSLTTLSSEAKASSGAASEKIVLEEKRRAIASCLKKAFPAPDGVTDEQWLAFCNQRRKKLNDRSYLLLTNKLTKLCEAGHIAGELIDLAIERGWETVFEPFKRQEQQKPYVSKSGFEYRGDRDSVKRQAERRRDMDTYWAICGEERVEREARSVGGLTDSILKSVKAA